MIKLYLSYDNNHVDIRNYKKCFSLQPNIQIVLELNQADYLVCFLASKNLYEASKIRSRVLRNAKNKIDEYNKIKDFPSEKTIFIDYTDHIFTNFCSSNKDFLNCFLYFKRNCVKRHNNISYNLINYKREVIPISYYVTDNILNYLKSYKNNNIRDYDISCLFNNKYRGLRNRIYKFFTNENDLSKKYKIHCGLIKSKTNKYNKLNNKYFNLLLRTKIIVTATPKNHEGDYRTFEAFASGSLVMVDYNIVPIENPFIHKKHVIYYKNEYELKNYLNYYLENSKERDEIAKNGYEHCMKYHTNLKKAEYVINHIYKKLI